MLAGICPVTVRIEIHPGIQMPVIRCGHSDVGGLAFYQCRSKSNTVLVINTVVIVAHGIRTRYAIQFRVDIDPKIKLAYGVTGSIISHQRRI